MIDGYRLWKRIGKLAAVCLAAGVASFVTALPGLAADGAAALYTNVSTVTNGIINIPGESGCGDPCQGHRLKGSATASASNPGVRISVTSGKHTIYLKDLDIDMSYMSGIPVISVENNAEVELVLESGTNNTLTAGKNAAGIYVAEGAKLSISAEGSGDSEGKLSVTGGENGAGIGGNGQSVPGSITIRGGVIKATGGTGAAGIGGTASGGKGAVSIKGGTVTAEGGGEASDIICSTLSSDKGDHGLIIGAIEGDAKGFNGIVQSSSPSNITTVYGEVNLKDTNFSMSTGTLKINSGGSVTIDPDKLTGNVKVTGTGSIVYDGVLTASVTVDEGVKQKQLLTPACIKVYTRTYKGMDWNYAGGLYEFGSSNGREVDSTGWTAVLEKKGVSDFEPVSEAVDAGEYQLSFQKDGYGTVEASDKAKVLPIDLKLTGGAVPLDVKISSPTYTGEELEPEVSVTATVESTKVKLVQGKDFSVEYDNNRNAGENTASATIQGLGGNAINNRVIMFTINPANLSDDDVTVELSEDTFTYNGKEQKPVVTVKKGSKELTKDTDYEVSYDGKCTDAGPVTVTVTGKGNYTGTNTASYTIEPKTVEITGVTAIDREYNGTAQVEIAEITLKEDDILADDQGKLKADVSNMKGTIPGSNKGEYTEVQFDSVSLLLDGSKTENYAATPIGEWIALTDKVTIGQQSAPEAPELEVTYDVSRTDPSKFTATVKVKKPIEGLQYLYSIDGETETRSNEFDRIAPQSTHTFTAWTEETENVAKGKEGKKEVAFDLLSQEAPEAFKMEFTPNADDATFTATIPEVAGAWYAFGKDESALSWSYDNTKTDCKPDTEYTGWIKLGSTATHKESEAVKSVQTSPKLQVKTPVIKPDGGKFLDSQKVEITCETEGVEIYYTTNNREPSKADTKYTEPFTVDSNVTVKAIAIKEGMEDSAVAAATFVKAGDNEIKSKLEIEEDIPKVDAGLTDQFDSVDEIKQHMTRILTDIDGYTYLNMAFYDITIYISVDGGDWVKATADNFPKSGVTITMPYPEGTGKSTHDFVVCHMFTETSDRLGTEAGKTEQPTVTKTADGISFKVKGTSPVAIAWKQISQAVSGSGGNNGNSGTGGTDGAGGTNGSGTSGLSNVRAADVNGNGTGTNGNNANGNGAGGTDSSDGTDADGTDTNGTDADGNDADGTDSLTDQVQDALSSVLPKTGDPASLMKWVILIAVSLAVIIVVVIRRRRR